MLKKVKGDHGTLPSRAAHLPPGTLVMVVEDTGAGMLQLSSEKYCNVPPSSREKVEAGDVGGADSGGAVGIGVRSCSPQAYLTYTPGPAKVQVPGAVTWQPASSESTWPQWAAMRHISSVVPEQPSTDTRSAEQLRPMYRPSRKLEHTPPG